MSKDAEEIATRALSEWHCGSRSPEQCAEAIRRCGCEANAKYVVDALRAAGLLRESIEAPSAAIEAQASSPESLRALRDAWKQHLMEQPYCYDEDRAEADADDLVEWLTDGESIEAQPSCDEMIAELARRNEWVPGISRWAVSRSHAFRSSRGGAAGGNEPEAHE